MLKLLQQIFRIFIQNYVPSNALNMNDKYSKIKNRETNKSVLVKIGSDLKPEIISAIVEKWQLLLDTVAKIADVPSGLIMKLNEETIQVFLRSQTEGNPYNAGEEEKLVYGLYCETVIAEQKELLVPDATKNKLWKDNNPDIEINMISYLGFPINWPDGEVFGTVCLLDNKENFFNENYKKLLFLTKKHIESDLHIVVSQRELEKKNEELAKMNDIKTRFLSLISHDVRGGIGTLNEFLKLIIQKLDDYEIDKLKDDLNMLSQSAGSAYLVLENLLSWSKNDLLQLEPNKKQIDIVLMIENLLIYFKQSLEMKNIKVVKKYCKNSIIVFADKNMINTSIRNILSNAIKYNHVNGKIIIEIICKIDQTIIRIEDTGIGMDNTTKKKLFSYSKSNHSEGSEVLESSGLGLILANDFLKKNNASENVESEIGKGSVFEIIL